MKILLCNPTYFGIEYSINPWMDINNNSNRFIAIKQWQRLRDKLKELDVEVCFLDPKPNLPDMVFTANAGVVFNNKFFPSNFKHEERQGEQKYFIDWFKNNGYEIIHLDPQMNCEGAGDILISDNVFWNGSGFRSDYELGCKIYRECFGNYLFVNLELNDPKFYHLDTCLCPLKDKLVIANLDAFKTESARLIEHTCTVIQPPKEECDKFACNSVVVNNHIIMPEGCPETTKKLESHGYTVHPIAMTEFIKSGGACKCLTIAI